MKSNKPVLNATAKTAVLILLLTMAACASQVTKTASPIVPIGNAERLMARPDAPDAVKAAPEWTRDALHTVNALESQNKELQAK